MTSSTNLYYINEYALSLKVNLELKKTHQYFKDILRLEFTVEWV